MKSLIITMGGLAIVSMFMFISAFISCTKQTNYQRNKSPLIQNSTSSLEKAYIIRDSNVLDVVTTEELFIHPPKLVTLSIDTKRLKKH